MRFLPSIHYYFFCYFFCFCVVLIGFYLFFIGFFSICFLLNFFCNFFYHFFFLLRVRQLKKCAHKRKINHYWRTNFRALICYKRINPLVPNVGYLTCEVASLKRLQLRSPWSETGFVNGAGSCLDRAMSVYSMTPICTVFLCKLGHQTKIQA